MDNDDEEDAYYYYLLLKCDFISCKNINNNNT